MGFPMFNALCARARLTVPAVLLPLLSACGGGGAEPVDNTPFFPAAEDEWQLVWSDEFDGDSLDPANWEPQIGDGSEYGLDRWGNNEQQWYLAENATVADGFLTITAKAEEVVTGFPYTSARLRSANKFEFQYGRVEIRAQAAAGQGLWSAGWMLPTDSPYGSWAAIGEIDIMEIVNAETDNERTFQTLHYGFPWPLNQQTGTDVEVEDPAGTFHVYAIEWEGDEIRWFVDDRHILTIGADHYYSYYYKSTSEGYEQAPNDAPFDTPFHLLLNLAVGGNLPGVVEPGDIPSAMVVDYVRVYECSYGLPDGNGCNSNADRTLERPDAQDPFEASFPLYTDGAEAFSWVIGGETVERQLAVNSFWNNDGALSFMEVEEEGRGTVIEVTTSNLGNISINSVDESTTELFGFGNTPNFFELHAGALSFDMYIDSASTDLDSSILIKMDSGFPALGFKELKVSEMPLDTWFTYHVKVNDLLANSGDQPLDTSALVSLFVLEPTSFAKVKVDNIALSCGHPGRNGCGVRPPGGEVDGAFVPVFIDGEVGPLWDKGICGSDTGTGFTDYCGDGNTNNHITWTVTDSGDPDIGNALSVNFAADGEDGVFFFGSAGGVDLSDFTAGGKLKFDMRIPSSTVSTGMIWKVDCFFPCSTGDQVLDLSGYTADTWETFEFDVSTLAGLGVDLTRVNAGLVLFPTFGAQQGYSFEVGNVRYEVESAGGGGASLPPITVFDNGVVGDLFEGGIGAFDEAIGYASCSNDPAGCPSIDWRLVEDDERGTVLEVSHGAAFAGLFFETLEGRDVSEYIEGSLTFDIKVEATGINSSGFIAKVDCFFPCGASDLPIGQVGLSGWETVEIPVIDLVNAGLDLSNISNGLVIFPAFGETDGVVYRLDNVQWVGPGGADGGPVASLEQKVLDAGMAVEPFTLSAYDEAIGFASCPGDPAGCPSIGWAMVEDAERGPVLEVSHAASSNNAGLILATDPIDVSDFADGFLAFDINVLQAPAGDMFAKADCGFPCTSGDQNIGSAGSAGWETVELSVADLVAGGLDLTKVNTGIVVIPQIGGQGNTVYRLDNVRWYVP
jgi:beta-glucanase (GH16 family)